MPIQSTKSSKSTDTAARPIRDLPAVLFQLAIERGLANAELLGGLELVVSGRFQRVFDCLFFECG